MNCVFALKSSCEWETINGNTVGNSTIFLNQFSPLAKLLAQSPRRGCLISNEKGSLNSEVLLCAWIRVSIFIP